MSRLDRTRLVVLLCLGATALCAQCETTPRGAAICAAILLLSASGITLAALLYTIETLRNREER